MNSLITEEGNAEIVRRLESLVPERAPGWGKMSAPRMLAHCQRPLQVAAGRLELKRGLIGFLFGRMAKRKFVDGTAAFSQNSPTDPRFLVPDAQDFGAELATLIGLVREFGAQGAQTTAPHPFFGKLGSEDWDRLMWKHLDHHLRQFGV